MLTYEQHAQFTQNPTAKKLLLLMAKKQTNLSLSLDVSNKQEFLRLADLIGPEICLLKTHIDIIDDFDHDFLKHLIELSKKHQFLIFEDRKFADIGSTVKSQYAKGIYRIADWAHITNAHPIMGEGIIQGMKEVGLPRGNALLLLAQLSSKGNLIDSKYTETAIKMAKKHADFVIGFISQEKLTDDPSFIYMCPGVHLSAEGDSIGQQYKTPAQAIAQGNDIIIVGRGIYEHANPLAEAKRYREVSWLAYQKALQDAAKMKSREV